MNDKVSVIIPARNEQFLSRTVDDLLSKAKGPVQIIAVLDGYWPDPILRDHPNLVLLHFGEAQGMRAGINAAARIATGKYLMKTDAHCMFELGYDEILKADCQPDWLLIPSRYSLKAETWDWGRGPIDYLYMTYPYIKEDQFGYGLHGKKWLKDNSNMGPTSYYGIEQERKDILLDEIMTFQGSCWFMHRDFFFNTIGELDTRWYNIHQEAQELSCKAWLSGGKCMLTKKTRYAHLHKGNAYGRGYRLFKHKMEETQDHSADYWFNDRWSGQKHSFRWLIEKFWPVPHWPVDWDDPKYLEAYKRRGYASDRTENLGAL